MSRQKISAVIIAFMEENCIAKCLASLDFCDEIIVVDSGSTDATVAICEHYGAKVIQQSWLGFGLQKQFAVNQAANDWVLCLDADEVISDVLQATILQVLQQPSYQLYKMPRCNRFLGRSLRYGEGYPDYNIRLFNRRFAQWSNDSVHEKVESSSECGVLQGDIIHNSAETLEKYLNTQNRYTSIQAGLLYEQGKKIGLAKIVFSPLLRFFKFYMVKRGFLDGLPGFIHISIGCINSFIKYAKLYELNKTPQSRRQK